MKTRVGIGVLAWAAIMSATVAQAWGQAKCPGGTSQRCVSCADLDKSKPRGIKAVCECQAPCQKADSDSAGPVVSEPRRLALPHGSYRRLRAGDTAKSAAVCGCKECNACRLDGRHDTIFGTETIFGDLSPKLSRDRHACPYEDSKAGHRSPLGSALSKLDAAVQRVFVCQRGTCNHPGCKGADGGKSASQCDCETGPKTAPASVGDPAEPESANNPFHDDTLEPAPLPPKPRMTSASSKATPPAKSPQANKASQAEAKLVSSQAAVPAAQTSPSAGGSQTPQRIRLVERAVSTTSAKPRPTSSPSRDDDHGRPGADR